MNNPIDKLLYPPVSFHFLVSFVGPQFNPTEIRFQSVSGLEVSMETETYREGGENRFVHTVPTRAKYSNLVCKRGLLLDSKLINWAMNSINNLEIQPTNMVVSLLNESHLPLMTWNVVNAFPIKWSISEFNGEQSGIAIETFELYYQYFTLLKV